MTECYWTKCHLFRFETPLLPPLLSGPDVLLAVAGGAALPGVERRLAPVRRAPRALAPAQGQRQGRAGCVVHGIGVWRRVGVAEGEGGAHLPRAQLHLHDQADDLVAVLG